MSAPAADPIADDRVSTALAALIHELGPGARLPSERELTARLRVSRTALRDRLQLLEGLGVISRRQGSGTFVQPLDPTGLAMALDLGLASSHLTLQALHIVRLALERQAAIEAAQVRDPVRIAYLERAVAVIADAPDDAAVDEADFRFHDVLLRAAGNPALTFFADALRGVLQRALVERRAEMRRLLGDHEVMVKVHQEIFEAVRAGDPAAAAIATDAHFDAYNRFVDASSDGRRPRPGTADSADTRQTRPRLPRGH